MYCFQKTSFFTVCILLLAACGERSDTAEHLPPAPAAVDVVLPTSKLVIAELTPPPEPTEVAQDTCPYATPEAVNAAIRNPAGEDLVLKWARDGQCEFNMNIGFAVRLRGEPLSTARPPEKMAYNLDNPAVVEKVAAPGSNPTVVFDPTWKDDAPRAFAMTFERGDQQYTITTTGLITSREQLIALAQHMDLRLEKLGDDPFPPEQPIVSALDPCSALAPDTLKALFGAARMEVKQSSRASGACDYEGEIGRAGQRIKVSTRFERATGAPTAFHYNFQPFDGDESILHQEVRTGASGHYWHDWLVLTDAGRATVSVKAPDPYPMEQAVALVKSVQSRLEP